MSSEVRKGEFFFTIDVGFVNRRLCLSCLSRDFHARYWCQQKPGSDAMTSLANDRLLTEVVLDFCQEVRVPTLLKALEMRLDSSNAPILFMSNANLFACKDIRDAPRVWHSVDLDVDCGKPVSITYHTEHIVSSTGKERLEKGGIQSIVGLLHEKRERYEIEPIVIGTPLFQHVRNPPVHPGTLFNGTIWGYGEIRPEDIAEFSKSADVEIESPDEWMNVMSELPEKNIKQALARLLSDPMKKDWGRELNDIVTRLALLLEEHSEIPPCNPESDQMALLERTV